MVKKKRSKDGETTPWESLATDWEDEQLVCLQTK